jgi:hypothetical protein
MSPLIDALPDEIMKAAANDQAMSPVFKRAGARSLRGGSVPTSVSGEKQAIAARTHQILRGTLVFEKVCGHGSDAAVRVAAPRGGRPGRL